MNTETQLSTLLACSLVFYELVFHTCSCMLRNLRKSTETEVVRSLLVGAMRVHCTLSTEQIKFRNTESRGGGDWKIERREGRME